MSGFLENEGIKAVCFDIDGTFYPLFQTRLRVALASLSSLPFAISYNKARQRVRTEDSFLSLPPLSEKERAERMCRYMWDRSDEESISYFIGKEKKVFFDRYERLFSGIKPYEGVVETIEELKKRGFHIFALDIRNEEREENGITYIRTDLTKNEEIERAKRIVEEKTDSISFIANFSGCVILGSLFENAEGKAERIFSLNFFTTFNFNRIFIPMVMKEKGKVVVISSEYGKIAAIPLHGYYPASKHAVEAYADSLRRELKPSGVKVITIRPGAFKTAMQGAVEGQFEALLNETSLYKAPLRRMKHIMVGELKKAKDPEKLGRKVAKIASLSHPRAHYNIGNSFKMKLMTLVPSPLLDWIFTLFF